MVLGSWADEDLVVAPGPEGDPEDDEVVEEEAEYDMYNNTQIRVKKLTMSGGFHI